MLSAMRSRFDDGFSSSDRRLIEHLYGTLLNRHVRRSGCADCYRDAYIELTYFINHTKTLKTMSNYVLKPGVVIHPAGSSKFYANASITDEVAEAYLAEFPKAISKFKSYPSDYLSRIEARVNSATAAEAEAAAAEAVTEEATTETTEAEAVTEEATTETTEAESATTAATKRRTKKTTAVDA